MWTEEDVRGLIREIVADLAPSPADLVASARLIEDLGFHSLALLELALSLEDEFGLSAIDEAVAREILTLGDVEEHVLGELAAASELIRT